MISATLLRCTRCCTVFYTEEKETCGTILMIEHLLSNPCVVCNKGGLEIITKVDNTKLVKPY